MDPYVFGGALWGTLYSAAHAVTLAPDGAQLKTACTALCCMLRALRTCLPCELCRVTYDAHMQTCHGSQGRSGVFTRPSTLMAAENAARASNRNHADPAAAYPALHCIVYVDSAVRRKLNTGDNGGTLRVARRVSALGGGYGGSHDVLYILALMAAHAQSCLDTHVRAARARATAKFARAVAVLLGNLPKYAALQTCLLPEIPASVTVVDAARPEFVERRVHRAWCKLHNKSFHTQAPVLLDLQRRVDIARGKL